MWPGSTPLDGAGAQVEFERPDGARLRIHYREPQPALVDLVRAFLEQP